MPQQVISSIMRNYTELKAILKVLYGNTRLLNIMVGRVMFVHIVLRGFQIERVFVRGLDEEDSVDGKCSQFNSDFSSYRK
jgi:hypothetical protein